MSGAGDSGSIPSIYLVGYRASGKSAVARRLAALLARPCIDTDQLIVERERRSIAEIFAASGEAAFREIEAAVVTEICDRARRGESIVVATGGGAVLRPGSVEAMRGSGAVVWLTASAATLRSRIERCESSAARPPLRGRSAADEVEEVLRERLPLYRNAADLEVSTESLDPEATAARVLEALRGGRMRQFTAFP